MDSENNYDIVPVNNSCNNIIHTDIIVSSPGSDTSKSNQNIDIASKQLHADGQYDNVDNISVKPLYGGKKNILFTIKFRNKIVNIESLNEESAIKRFLDNKIYKKDHLLEIIYKNKSALYIIKNGKNKFKKIN